MRPTRSLFLDCLPEDQPEGTYRRAYNIVHTNSAKRNEPGMEMINNLGFHVAHIHGVDGGAFVLFGTADADGTSGSQIGILEPDGNYSCRLKSDALKIDPDLPIKTVYFRNAKKELVICWTDGVSTPKVLNLDNLPFEVNELKYPKKTDHLVLLELFSQFISPEVRVNKFADSGGQTLSGLYSFCFAYEYPEGGCTNMTQIVGPVSITNDAGSKGVNYYDGCEAGTPTSKVIRLSISKLDQRFKYLRFYVIKKIGGVVTTEYFGRKEILSSQLEYTYTGAESAEAVSLESVLVSPASYTRAKTMTILGKQLFLANLEESAPINYQKYANNIKVKWVRDHITLSEVRGSYKDEITILNKRAFFPDEVLALYIRFIMLDGSSSPAFHIPGREKGMIQYEGVEVEEDALISTLVEDHPELDFLSHDLKIDPEVKFFHTRETAREDGTMGFWENATEVYPDTEDYDIYSKDGKVAGKTLRGSKVRHHKTPGVHLLAPSGILSLDANSAADCTSKNSFKTSGNVQYPVKKESRLEEVIVTGNMATYGTWLGNRYTAFKKQVLTITGKAGASAVARCNGYYTGDVVAEAFVTITKNEFQNLLNLRQYSSEQRTGDWDEARATVLQLDLNISVELNMGDFIEIEAGAGVAGAQIYNYDYEVDLAYRAGDTAQSIATGTVAPIIGINVSDIYIPEEIRDKVAGFEILYAKRTFNNMRVLGQGAVFHYQNKHPLEPTELGPSIGSKVVKAKDGNVKLDDSKLRFHSFDLLSSQMSASPSYIKEQFRLKIDNLPLLNTDDYKATTADRSASENTTFQSHFIADFVKHRTSLPYYEERDVLRKVNSFKYIPGDTILSEDGAVLNNSFGEGHIFANIEHDTQPTGADGETMYGWGTGGGYFDSSKSGPANMTIELMIGALCQHRIDVYNSMFEQELASTGMFFQLNRLDTYEIPKLFGGDTFFNRFGTRLTTGLYLSEAEKSENKFEAVKAVYMFPVYSVHNIDLRHEGIDPKDRYYPKVGTSLSEYKSWIRRETDIENDNTFFYNTDYSSVNDMTRAFPYSPSLEFVSKFPFRIIRSNIFSEESKELSMRIFPALDYYEIPNTRGEITNIEAFGEMLFINTRQSLFRTLGNESIQVSSGEVALGKGDIFRIPPREIMTTDNGYAGCQHISSCRLTKLGYLFADAEGGKIFLAGNGLDEISNKGLREYFLKTLKAYGANLPDSFSVAYDEDFNRLLLTLPGGETLSYSPEAGGWTCFHSYTPDQMTNSRTSVVSVKGTKVYRHNTGKPGMFYGARHKSSLDICFNPYPQGSSLFASFNWRSIAQTSQNVFQPLDTFTHAVVYDAHRCSGEIQLQRMVNIRNAEGEHRFNNFRDMVKNSNLPFMDEFLEVLQDNIDKEKPWENRRRFVGTYVILRLVHDNVSENTIYLHSVDVNYRLSAR